MAFTLITAPPSPFGRKVAIAMIEKGIACETRYDMPWDEGSCTPDYSPLQQLPILITDCGEYIYDSAYILDWLELLYPEPALLPADVGPRLAALKRRLLGERAMEIAQALIFEHHRPQPSEAWITRQTRKVAGTLDELERLYASEDRDPRASLDQGDIAVATTLLLFEFAVSAHLSPDLDVLKWRGRRSRLTHLVEALEGRPSFLATAPAAMEVNLGSAIG